MLFHERTKEVMTDYPIVCRSCGAAAGYPFSVSTLGSSNDLLVRVRCRQCQVEWSRTRRGLDRYRSEAY